MQWTRLLRVLGRLVCRRVRALVWHLMDVLNLRARRRWRVMASDVVCGGEHEMKG